MRIIEVTCCERCPYFELTSGYYRVWVCRHQQFPKRYKNGRIKKDGSYPKYAGKRVANGCPLKRSGNDKPKS